MPLLLMSLSLSLLLIFEGLWLKKAYDDAYQDLDEHTGIMFAHTVRDIEDSVFYRIFLEPLNLLSNDTVRIQDTIKFHDSFGLSDSVRIKVNNFSVDRKLPKSWRVKAHDSMKNSDVPDRFSAFENRQLLLGKRLKRVKADTTISVSISKTSSRTWAESHPSGSLSLFMALSGEDGADRDVFTVFKDTLDLEKLIFKGFEEKVHADDLPLRYQIISVPKDDTLDAVGILHSYTDLPSGQTYAVQLDSFKPYLAKKLLPQILFCIFLFSITAFAFWVVFRSLRQQKRLTQLKNEFISNVTHELKTPITTVGVAVEALSSFNALEDPEKTAEYLDISRQELNRLSILVDRVLKMSLFERKEPDLKLEHLDIADMLQEILNSMKLQFEKASAQVQLHISHGSYSLKGDRIHLTSVVYNLIDNALKYSTGKPEIDINLSMTEAGFMKLSVRDKGIGISKEFKDKIFDKFFRVPTGDHHNIKGYGLGLSYVASVVNKHNGNISVDSQEGVGTCFTILLPAENE